MYWSYDPGRDLSQRDRENENVTDSWVMLHIIYNMKAFRDII